MIWFACPVCKTRLSVPAAGVATSGPCPNCKTVIESPSFEEIDPSDPRYTQIAEGKGNSPRSLDGGRGRIRADGYLDHDFNERRELSGTLRVLAVSLAVMAFIAIVILYMQQWMTD